MVSGSWISLGVGDIVGTDVDWVGFLVGLRWVGRLVGLTTGARDVVGRPVGLRVTGFLVGLGAIASAALNDRSSIAKYSLVTGAGESVITLALVKSQNVKGNNLATWRCWWITGRENGLTSDSFQCRRHWALLVLFSRGALHAYRGEGDCNRGKVRVDDSHSSRWVSCGSVELILKVSGIE